LVQPHFFLTSWNKIVKKSLTENLISGETGVSTAEDLLYATEILLKADMICLTPYAYYVYFVNTDSLTRFIRSEQFLERMIPILVQTQRIVSHYRATPQFVNNILKYLEKHIYFTIAKASFLEKGTDMKKNELLKAFRLFSEMPFNRLNRLSLAMSNKYYSLIPLLVRFGPRPVLGIVLRSIRKKLQDSA
jgi:hypothetical protein